MANRVPHALLSAMMLSLGAVNPLLSSPSAIINASSSIQRTRLPATEVDTEEHVTILFPDLEALNKTIHRLASIDEEAAAKVIAKLQPHIGHPLYPSQLAHLLFEVAFTDSKASRLSSTQRRNNMGYIMCNLGSGNPDLTEKLYAFYYGYSFSNFAEPRLP